MIADAAANLVLEPLVPTWVLALLSAGFVLGLVVLARSAAPLLVPRAIAALMMITTLAGPKLGDNVRADVPDIGIAIIDDSASMAVDLRSAEAAAALVKLQSDTPQIDWQIERVAQVPGAPTRLARTIRRAAMRVPADRLAGIVVISDGIVADTPSSAARPTHVLIAGDPDLRDRRLSIVSVPAYSVVGQAAEVSILVDDGTQAQSGGEVSLRLEDANGVRDVTVRTGTPQTLEIPVTRRGISEVALSVPALSGEVTRVNNRALVRLNGVTDRLRVLLVSGVPYPGGRVWRDILKSDANIDLVHFTILRLPSSFDTTPPEQMSLIPFPVDELFQQHLPSFDLVVFDRFGLSELMSPHYFTRLGQHVRAGGGLLVVAGDEFDARGGLAGTALANILPARAGGPVITTPFRPALTDIGRRHPVTSALPAAWQGKPWGRWGMQANLVAGPAQVLMHGAEDRALLLLDRVGRGRVGMLASTHVWWWSRGVDGFGPRDELLRRTAHWLMQEPDLDENQLDVSAAGQALTINARSLDPPAYATLTGPDGSMREVALSGSDDGSTAARIKVADDGLFRVEAGGLQRFVLAGESAELAEVRPRAAPLDGAARETGGGAFWLRDGMPAIRHIEPGEAMAGPRWLGLAKNSSGAVIAVRRIALFPPPLALVLICGTLIFAWWREQA